MRWLNPAAFLGLFGLAVPILVHLFGRRAARRQRFPTLRLLRDAHPTPATRSRPSDILLLVLRCAVIIAAVLGLAQPQWAGTERSRAALVPVRAIIVDTGASMLRLTRDGSTALLRAHMRGEQLLDSAREGIIVETEQPGANVAGAASWLAGRSGARELVIISDFQSGSVAEGNLASVDSGIGIRFERVPVTSSTAESTAVFEGRTIVTVEARPNRTVATWPTPSRDTSLSIAVLAGAEEASAVRAAIAAARATTPHFGASGHRVAVVFPGYSTRRELSESTVPFNSSWQGDLLISLRRDRVLTAAADDAIVTQACDARGVVVARNRRGEVIAILAARAPGADHEVLVFACVEPGSVASAALLARTLSVLNPAPAMQEREPEFLPDETLRRWERQPTDVTPRAPEETSPDGRWFWLVAIALLLGEEWLRRRSSRKVPSAKTEVPRERVA